MSKKLKESVFTNLRSMTQTAKKRDADWQKKHVSTTGKKKGFQGMFLEDDFVSLFKQAKCKTNKKQCGKTMFGGIVNSDSKTLEEFQVLPQNHIPTEFRERLGQRLGSGVYGDVYEYENNSIIKFEYSYYSHNAHEQDWENILDAFFSYLGYFKDNDVKNVAKIYDWGVYDVDEPDHSSVVVVYTIMEKLLPLDSEEREVVVIYLQNMLSEWFRGHELPLDIFLAIMTKWPLSQLQKQKFIEFYKFVVENKEFLHHVDMHDDNVMKDTKGNYKIIDHSGFMSGASLIEEEKQMKSKDKIDHDKAKEIGDKLKVDWDKIPLEQFHMGMNVELEHTDVTKGDLMMTGKIALAHLKEFPDYYTRLKKVEDKKTMKEEKGITKEQLTEIVTKVVKEADLLKRLGQDPSYVKKDVQPPRIGYKDRLEKSKKTKQPLPSPANLKEMEPKGMGDFDPPEDNDMPSEERTINTPEEFDDFIEFIEWNSSAITQRDRKDLEILGYDGEVPVDTNSLFKQFQIKFKDPNAKITPLGEKLFRIYQDSYA